MFTASAVIKAIEDLEKELNYYRDQFIEQKEIIEQLTGTGKPRNYVYMHPWDVNELISKSDTATLGLFKNLPGLPANTIQAEGRNIRQSPNIPPVTRVFHE